MTKEEMKNIYSAFITGISEILGLGKPVDILKLCATTDLFFRPLEKRIAELEKENAELKKELKKWKDEWQEQVQKANDESYARTLQTIQLTKAKKIIKNLMVFAEMDDREYEKEYKEAEQFLSEVEKCGQ